MSNEFLLSSINLTNYRCFESAHLQFKPGINVVLGNNGSGKTSVLSATAIALGAWFLGLGRVASRGIQNEEIRQIRQKKGDLTVFESAGECTVGATALVFDQDVQWRRTRHTGNTTSKYATDYYSIAKQMEQRIRDGEDVLLPLIAFYGVGRLWGERRLGVTKKTHIDSDNHRQSRYLGYMGALDPAANVKTLKRWMKKLAEASFHEGRTLPSLEAIYSVITLCVEQAKRTFWDPREDDIVIEFDNGEQTPMYLMSDGQRNVCAMVGDIAMRCIQLNPNLSSEAVRQTPGVVLIDEIDQHLHPLWQRKILGSLATCFSKIQFIVTTHSPFIVQSLQDQQITLLEEGRIHTTQMNQPMSLEDTAQQVMHVDNPMRSDSFTKTVSLGKEIFKLQRQMQQLDKQSEDYKGIEIKLTALRKQLAENSAMYSDNPLVTAYLQGVL